MEHPLDHVGVVRVRVLPEPANVCTRHKLTLRWGSYMRRVEFIPCSHEPSSFIHHKMNMDVITLHASVDPPSRPPADWAQEVLRSEGNLGVRELTAELDLCRSLVSRTALTKNPGRVASNQFDRLWTAARPKWAQPSAGGAGPDAGKQDREADLRAPCRGSGCAGR